MKNFFIIGFIFCCTSSLVAQQKNTDSWKLSVQTWTFHLYSFLETIEKADSLGLQYLEVYPGQKIGGDIPGAFSYTLSTTDRDKLKKILQQKGIRVMALGVIDKEYYNENNLEQFFAFARYMDIPFITAEPEWKDLDRFNELAALYHVKVALHCHPKPSSHYWHPDLTVAAMQGRASIGAWPDLGHWARNGVDILPALKKMKGKLWGLHLKDIQAFDNTAAEDTILGKGVCRIAAVLKELQQQDFNGVLSIEYEVNPAHNMEAMRENIAYYFQQIRKH